MTKIPFTFLASLTLCAALTSGTAFARGNDHGGKPGGWHNNATVRDHDRDRDHVRGHDRDRDRDRDDWRERREHRDRDWRRDHRRHHGFFGNDGRPHGWSQGRKTGWGNCDVPPGQAKKVGCSPRATWHRPRPVRDTRIRGRHGDDRDRDHDRD